MGGEKCCLNGADVSDGNSPCRASPSLDSCKSPVQSPLKGKERKKDGLFFFPLLNIYIRSATENNFIKRGYNERIKEEFFFFYLSLDNCICICEYHGSYYVLEISQQEIILLILHPV